ncbi:hypothetical protein ACFLZP_02960 [Patescibacteria group bacterium]
MLCKKDSVKIAKLIFLKTISNLTMSPDNRLPHWQKEERRRDFAWIRENNERFWALANSAHSTNERGAIVASWVDPQPNTPPPLTYIPLQTLRQFPECDENTVGMNNHGLRPQPRICRFHFKTR